MSLPILHRSADPTELEDVANLNFVPKKKDIMKVPLIPDTDTFDSQQDHKLFSTVTDWPVEHVLKTFMCL